MERKYIKYYALFIFVILIFIGVQVFNRAPERDTPGGEVIVSPANGKVIAVERGVGETVRFFKNEIEQVVSTHMNSKSYHIVVIEMNLDDVHVQRAPISGELIYQEHMAGEFKNAIFSEDKVHLANINEKNFALFRHTDGLEVGVVQVAGTLARRIISWGKVGDMFDQGEIYGRITLGSQVVVIFSDTILPTVEVGQDVVDGVTILGYF